MPPRANPAVTNSDLAVLMAGLSEKVIGIDGRLTEVSKDAREARDTAREVATKLDVEGIPAKLSELRVEMHTGDSELRTDFSSANARLKGELGARLDGHDDRIGALETARTAAEAQARGKRSVLRWTADHMPWLIALGVALASYFGWGKHS